MTGGSRRATGVRGGPRGTCFRQPHFRRRRARGPGAWWKNQRAGCARPAGGGHANSPARPAYRLPCLRRCPSVKSDPPDLPSMTAESGVYPSVVALLRRRAVETGDKVAYTFLADGGTARGSVTYAEVDRRARAIGARLQSLGLTGERALLLYPPGLDYVAALSGCRYPVVVAVPAYPPRRHPSLERLRAIITDARAAAVLATPAVGAAAADLVAVVPGPREPRWLLSDQFPEEAAEFWREPPLSPE